MLPAMVGNRPTLYKIGSAFNQLDSFFVADEKIF